MVSLASKVLMKQAHAPALKLIKQSVALKQKSEVERCSLFLSQRYLRFFSLRSTSTGNAYVAAQIKTRLGHTKRHRVPTISLAARNDLSPCSNNFDELRASIWCPGRGYESSRFTAMRVIRGMPVFRPAVANGGSFIARGRTITR